jgi:hypothetical protein
MTNVHTVRVPLELMARADARGAQLGLDRGKYVRSLNLFVRLRQIVPAKLQTIRTGFSGVISDSGFDQPS